MPAFALLRPVLTFWSHSNPTVSPNRRVGTVHSENVVPSFTSEKNVPRVFARLHSRPVLRAVRPNCCPTLFRHQRCAAVRQISVSPSCASASMSPPRRAQVRCPLCPLSVVCVGRCVAAPSHPRIAFKFRLRCKSVIRCCPYSSALLPITRGTRRRGVASRATLTRAAVHDVSTSLNASLSAMHLPTMST